MAIGGRFQWGAQGDTPNTMFAMAEYPNGQQVFSNVRNVNYDGYQRRVETNTTSMMAAVSSQQVLPCREQPRSRY